MARIHSPNRDDLFIQMKWVIASRVIFALLLIVSCLVFSSGENVSFLSQPLLALYYLAAFILVLSIVYLVCLRRYHNAISLAYLQPVIDTILVTAIIYVTGSYSSMFTFLYLVVIIYAAILLFQKGSLVIAMLSSVQYGLLVEFEYFEVIQPFMPQMSSLDTVDPVHLVYRIVIFMAACFAVAVLSGILAFQLKGAKQDLKLAEEHLKRVERLAVMDELISGIAHEVKNPLASLAGSIQLLQEDAKPGSYEDKLMQIILRETDRLKQIVNDIRLFSKPSTRNSQMIKLDDAIHDTVELFLNDPEWNRKISFSMRLNANAYVNMDPAHLHQILWNLFKNAAQAIVDTGEIKVRVHLSKNNRVYLMVEDNGRGIDPEKTKHLFNPFFTTKPDGTGLGLSIIHRLIDTYGGMIDFESVPGKGTVFTVLLNGARA